MRELAELIANIKSGQSSAHAYILEGSPKAARDGFVSELLAGLGVHGLDVVRMEMSGKNSYKTSDAEAFSERLEMGAYGDHLIGLIDDADSLSEIVQNKLLKTLEEPRPKVMILLGASNRDSLLSTVRSRCSTIRLADYVDLADEEDGRVLISTRAGIFVVPDDFYFFHVGDVMDRITSAYNAAWRGDAGDIVYASDQMMEEKEKFMRTRARFPIGLKNREFLVFYQPKIDLRSNCLTGAEALSRWYRDGRLHLPADYIPDLEQTMDICRLDFYVLDQVCHDLRRWLDQGRQVVRVSVNFSRRHLIDPDLLSRILAVIDKYRVPHEYIEIELTETITDVEFRDLKRVTRGLQEAGIYTSVDDFGIGYSSLNLIREIPWNILKVDKNFLPLSEDNGPDRQNIMFRHVVSMAKEIGLICVAEGVETMEQVNILRKCGCDIAQGFFYDKPLPVKEFEERLDRHWYPRDNRQFMNHNS